MMTIRRPSAGSPPAAPPVLALALACFTLAVGAAWAAPVLARQPASHAGLPAKHGFDIPAGSLDQALSRFGRQAGVPVSVNAALTAGLSSAGLRGTYADAEALDLLLRGTGLEAARDAHGEYTLRKAAPGAAGTSVTALSAITVTGRDEPAGGLPPAFAGGQTARGARAGLLGNRDTMDVPFSLTSYTSDFLRHQHATTIADALAYDASVAVSQTGGMVDSYSIRGFPIAEGNVGELAFNGVYGVAPNYRGFTSYVERVEVLKGATGLLYGMSPDGGVGGVINIVPKRAGDEPLTRLTATYGQRSVAGGQLDLSRRFGAEDKWGIRVNASHEQGKTAVDHQRRKISSGAVALDYQGEQLTASLDLIFQNEDWDAPSRVYSVASGVDVPSAPDGRRNPTQTWGWSSLKDRSALLDVEYRPTDRLALFANVGHGRSTVDRFYDQQMVFSDVNGDFTSTPRYALFKVERDTASGGARIGFDTGPVQHTVTLQATMLDVTNYQNSADGTSLVSNLYEPVRYAFQNVAAPSGPPRIARSRLKSLALSDTLALLDGRLQLIVGARRQWVESDNWDRVSGALTSHYKQDAWTPAVGVIFKPSPSTMVYASYIEGLSKGDVAPQNADNAGEMFAPYKSKQYEVGFKADLGALHATISAFQLTKPSGFLSGSTFGVNGEQRNRGVELAIQGELARGLRIVGGATWLDAELTQTTDPAVQGNRPIGVPRWHATLGAEWDMSWLAGLTLTSGVIHSAKQYVNQQNSAYLPAWTRVDVGARYATAIQGRDVTLQLNLQNAFNRKYWSGVSQWGSFALGSPRTLSLTASMAF